MASRKIIRLTLVGFLTLSFFNCEQQIVGPIPNFDYEFDDFDDIDVEDVTLNDVTPDEITAGTMSNSGQDNFISAFDNAATNATSKAAIDQAIASLDAAFEPAQETFWNNLNTASLAGNIDNNFTNSSDQTIAQIQSAVADLAQYSDLNNLIPGLTLPSGRLLNNERALASATIDLVNIVTAINEALPECEAAANAAYNAALLKLETALNEQMALVNAKNSENLTKALDSRTAAQTAANTRHTDRKTLFLQRFNDFQQKINAATATFTAQQITLLTILNRVVYAINLYKSKELLQRDLEQILVVFERNLEAAETARLAMTNDANSKFNTAKREADNKRGEALESCHNQGGSSGG